MRGRKSLTSGFTLIELLIVILIIAILAVIVIPSLMGASRRAKESSLTANLSRIRYAVERFKADTGVYPTVLPDIVAKDASALTTPNVPAGSFIGAYISTEGGISGCGLPLDPFVDPADTDYTHHWKYDPATGDVSVPDAIASTVMMDGRTLGSL